MELPTNKIGYNRSPRTFRNTTYATEHVASRHGTSTRSGSIRETLHAENTRTTHLGECHEAIMGA